MNIKNYGFGARSKEVDDAYRKRQRGSSSQKRKDAQRLRRLREASEDKIEEKGLNIITDSESNAIQIMLVIKEMLDKKDLDTKLKLRLLELMIQAHIAIHGKKVASGNLNLDSQFSLTEIVKR